MADAESRPRHHLPSGLPLPDMVALVLQGGGALGSFQAGVIEEIAANHIEVDWVAGISIGAVNAALFAGNPPEKRLDALRAFWDGATAALPDFSLPLSDSGREFAHEWSAGAVMLGGVPGFFTPRLIPPTFAVPGSPGALSFYDSSPLRETLDRLVDWDLLNNGPVRLSVGAVELCSGNFRYFDTRDEKLDARHIMASGALPPGLPPIEIDGLYYWDGGLISNTPLTHILDRQDAETLIFQVDLFPAAAELPRNITDVLAREKEIRFSSRTRAVSDERLRLRQERQMVCKLLNRLPADLANDPEVLKLKARVTEYPVSLVQLIYRANAWEGGSRDFEFSARSMHEHWQAGRTAVAETMANAQLVAQNILDGNTAAFDLTQR
ncbi:patatin-like phospholipase family protein [Sphingomonas sp. JC676]|uniref:patatin-like phospholipase family protein n=1 Tax=Sphingomonas sp. JC676 TaxID=2768065 RepID=UPI0016584123|nr:patatin-like phospholipase family protein [Sphingomonas sp. JC676]MBC9033449.1 patatin-like phospholipase family protein [Sphingomonas sp. JC676]